MIKYVQNIEIFEWVIKVKTTLIQRDPLKGTSPDNNTPIMFLLMKWKILKSQIREMIY